MPSEIPPQRSSSPASPSGFSLSGDSYWSGLAATKPTPWNLPTILGLAVLLLLWAIEVWTTWAAWGNLTVDSGHEAYVPWVLSQGKMLYRDVWFMYPPASPYVNSYLFRLFSPRLEVLYWAGSLAALGSALFLYLAGLRIGSRLAGWMGAAVLLADAFQPSLFCFPLPYSFGTVYACLAACCFLWLVLSAAVSDGWLWILLAAAVAAFASLSKIEFGAASFLTLAIFIAVRSYRRRSWKIALRDFCATLPGLLLCFIVVRWMVSIRGTEFITQENVMIWPTSYFMRTFGKFWLASTGFSLTLTAFAESARRTILFLGVWQGVHQILTWKHTARLWKLCRLAIFVAALGGLALQASWREGLQAMFFPQDMLLYVCVAALPAWWFFWKNEYSMRFLQVALILTFAGLLAFRILLKTAPSGYAIYYNGPVVLAVFLLIDLSLPYFARSRFSPRAARAALAGLCLVSVFLHVRSQGMHSRDYAPMVTEVGMIRTWPDLADNYRDAMAFMAEKAALGESVLSVPEDTSLYFLSRTHCPIRIFQFTPGVVVPGRMTQDLIDEIEQKHVRYLLWSNRSFPEYGVPRFGYDFDQALGDYLRSHYHSVGPVITKPVEPGEWVAYIWERNAAQNKQ